MNDRLAELEEAPLEAGDSETGADEGIGTGWGPAGDTEEASAGGRSTDAPF